MEWSELKRGEGVSLWRQIERQVIDGISNGTITGGDRLPTELELADRFDVNRHTVRRAMRALEDDGLIRIEQGRGTFVNEHLIDYPVRRRTRFTENILAQNRQVGSEVLATNTLEATPEIGEALALETGAPALMIRTLGRADDRPLSLSDHYFDAVRFPELIDGFKETRSITQALRLSGVLDFYRKVTRVTTRLPDKDEARLLAQPGTRPVLVSESINVDPEDRPVEFGVTRFAGDRVQLVFEPVA